MQSRKTAESPGLPAVQKGLAPVVKVGVWQWAQPISTNSRDTRFTVLSLGPRAGGARNIMKLAKLVGSSNTAASVSPPMWKVSLGGADGEQLGVSSRSVGNRKFVMPISTLYASPAKISSDLFCAFQPKRLTVPSLALRFSAP